MIHDIFLMNFIFIVRIPDFDKCYRVYMQTLCPPKTISHFLCVHITFAIDYLDLHRRISQRRNLNNLKKHEHNTACWHVLAGKRHSGSGPLPFLEWPPSSICLSLELCVIQQMASLIDSSSHY